MTIETWQHHFVETNGIRMHYVEMGQGPLVVLCHGFPESWYSWRHQITALADAGYRVVAPDQRGYGQTEQPQAIAAYDIFQLVGDIVGLVHALGEERAHDWGAPVAWHCALLRPDMFHALALMSVPYAPRMWGDIRPTEALALAAGEGQHYITYFQEPGKAEAKLETDVRKTMLSTLYSLSGDPAPEDRWHFIFSKSETLLDAVVLPENLPAWLEATDLDYFVQEYEASGFRGGLNWYRNLDRNWEMTSFLSSAPILQPTLFIAGETDAVIVMYQEALQALELTVPNLRKKVVIPEAGHWIQQERPEAVNKLLLDFFAQLNI